MNRNQRFLHFFLYFLLLILTISLFGCSSKNDYFTPDIDTDYIPSLEDEYSVSVSEALSPSKDSDISSDSTEIPDVDSEYQGPLPGQITSSAWSDIENYDYWLSLFKTNDNEQYVSFNEYFTTLTNISKELNTKNKVTINVNNGAKLLEEVVVTIKNNSYEFTTKTDVFGNAHLYLPEVLSFPYTIICDNQTVLELNEYTKETIYIDTNIKPATSTKVLDIMFVIDTTGSMSDELEYLKAEIKDVIENVNAEEKNIRLGLLFYRDHGDVYTTKMYDFTTNIGDAVKAISKEFANGGGDTPEAVDEALMKAIAEASWSKEHSTKLLIHVLDAPPHNDVQIMQNYANSILLAASKGIRIIPVASSGIDKYTEFLLRTEAMITGGTYTYITNDSGIGNPHIEANTPENVVEYLNAMLVRLINEYYTGVKTEPVPYNKPNQ